MSNDDDFLDNIEADSETTEQEIDNDSAELTGEQTRAQAQRNLLARKRIDELMERKRLKELLDDSNDW